MKWYNLYMSKKRVILVLALTVVIAFLFFFFWPRKCDDNPYWIREWFVDDGLQGERDVALNCKCYGVRFDTQCDNSEFDYVDCAVCFGWVRNVEE